jgi:hypothetical protein
MVMHARKIPRLNDGYYDRNTAHPFEEKYPSKSHGSGYSDRHGNKSRESPNYSRSRDAGGSPSRQHRYSNKSSYMDRNKERLEKGSSSSPADRRPSHQSNSTTSRDGDRGQAANPDYSQKEKEAIEIHKNALRVSGEWSEHVSTSGKHYYYNYKTEVSKWEKPKDWVDPPTTPVNKSSRDKNGRDRDKHYTAASAKSASEDRYKHSSDRGRGQSTVSSSRAERGGSSSSSNAYPHATTATSMAAGYPEQRQSQRHPSGEQNHGGRAYQDDHRGGGYTEDRPALSHQKTWHGGSESSRDSYGGRQRELSRSTSTEGQYERYKAGQCPTTPTSTRRPAGQDYSMSGSKAQAHHASAAFNGARSTLDPSRNDNEDSRQMEDMDISPDGTPSNSRPGSRPNSRQGTPAASTPVPLSHATAAATSQYNNAAATSQYNNSGSQYNNAVTSHYNAVTSYNSSVMTSQYNSSVLGAMSALPSLVSMHHTSKPPPSTDLTQQAIQTLQKLHQALLMHQVHNGAETTTVSSHYMLPQVHSTIASASRLHPEDSRDPRDHRGHRDTGNSPIERKMRRQSPTPSLSTSQSLSLGTSSLAAAARKQDSVLLSSSLSKYYTEDLIGHVLGWQSDQAERQARQANRFSEEAHSVGSIQGTQVSVELKKARSLVRIAEIQSTLQEQRLMFSRQLIKELDNLKNMNSFMPYQDT